MAEASRISNICVMPFDFLQGAQLAEHHLQVVTTSATCDDMFASALDTFSEDFGVSGRQAWYQSTLHGTVVKNWWESY